jgi:hypothetical protein
MSTVYRVKRKGRLPIYVDSIDAMWNYVRTCMVSLAFQAPKASTIVALMWTAI